VTSPTHVPPPADAHEIPPGAEGSSVDAPTVDTRTAAPRPPRTARLVAVIAAGGALGGPARYGLGLAFPTASGTFPATTFAINVSGSFILALLLVFILDIWPPTTYVRPFAAVGFLGAYTTFSTWMVDTDRLLAGHHYGTAAADLFGSLGAGLAATTLGISLGVGVLTRRRVRTAEAVA
jgi:CrcB protein